MTISEVHSKLEQLSSTSKVNEKVELLKDFLEDSTFLKVVKYALDPKKMYNIKALPKKSQFVQCKCPPKEADKRIFKLLKKLAKSSGTSDVQKAELANATYDENSYEVISRIVKKDLRCGVSEALINRARPNTILVIPYMRCATEKHLDSIEWPAIVQEKADSMFVNMIIDEKGEIKFLTRSGQKVRQLKFLKKKIKNKILIAKSKRVWTNEEKQIIKKYKIANPMYNSKVYMGEMMVRRKKNILSRKEGNGILNQCIQGKASKADVKDVVLRIWDCVPLEDFWNGEYKSSYQTRYFDASCLANLAFINDSTIEMVRSKRVNSIEEAKEFYRKIRREKGEGAIVKNLQGFWKNNGSGSKDQIKLKNESDAELIIVGVEKGKKGTKYEKCMGNLICESSEGKIRVSVGGGFSDEQRGYSPIRNEKGGIIGINKKKAKKQLKYWKKQKGKIVTIIFESVIDDKTNRKQKSLYLPRFDSERFDRTDADSLKNILERLSEKETKK